jgi:hypothetical protein
MTKGLYYHKLSLDKRISLKGSFENHKDSVTSGEYWLILKMFGFVVAVDYFFTNDLDYLRYNHLR